MMIEQTSLWGEPRARLSDPISAHEAASVVKPGNADLIKAIRSYVWTFGPSTAYEIAEGLAGSRWQPDTVRTACARAGLKKACGIDNVVTPGGRPCALYCLPTETVPTHGRL